MTPHFAEVFEFNLGHTPGIYYALSYAISAVIFSLVVSKPSNKPRFILITAGFFVILSGLMTATDGVGGWLFLLVMTVIFGVIFLYFLLADDMTWLRALYFAARSFIVAEFAAALQWQLFAYFIESKNMPLNIFTGAVCLVTVYGVVFALTYYIEIRYKDVVTGLQLPGKYVANIVFLATLAFVLSNLSFAASDTPFSGTTNAEIFAIRTLADLSGVGMMLAMHMQICEGASRLEKENLSALLRMQEDSYRISAESIEVVNRKYHDLKHQLALLKADIPYDEKMRFFEEMEQEISAYEARNKTGNKTLDVLLSAKTLHCHRIGVTLTCVADGKELDFMRASDISVLFGNALDNAVESVSKIDDPDKRLIHLTVACQKLFLHIRVENCCEDKLEFKDGLPLTTKKDSAFHGFGVKSMRSIAEKYGGTLTTTLTDGWFELRILIPIPKSNNTVEAV